MRLLLNWVLALLLPACTFGESDTAPRNDDATEDDGSNDDVADDDDAEGPLDLVELNDSEPGGFEALCSSVWAFWSDEGCPIAGEAVADCAVMPSSCETPYLEFLQCTLDQGDCLGGGCSDEIDTAVQCLDSETPPPEPEGEPDAVQPEPTFEPDAPIEPEPTSEPDPEPEPVPEPEGPVTSPNQGVAIRRMTEAVCALDANCVGLLANLLSGNEAYCLEHYERIIQASVDLPDTRLGTADLDACSEALEQLSCDAWQGGEFPCDLPGTRENGDVCSSGDQCASKWCDGSPYACGACSDPPEEGAACDGYWGCPKPMWCNEGRCEPLGTTGQGCDDASPCYFSADTCVDGVCVRRDRELGETCGPELGQPYCVVTGPPFLACSPEGLCVDAEIAMPGEPCPTLGWCGARSSCVDGTCEGIPEEGDACDDTTGCRWPSDCVDGVCKGPSTVLECDEAPQ